MDRDGYFGNSGTERDLVYRDLSVDLVAAGFCVIRYDNRGVRCNEMTMPKCPAGNSELQISECYLTACVDAEVRRTVSVQTQMDDVETMWNFTVSHPRVEPQRVVIWAHSEGGLNVARLVSARRIGPLGVVIVGAAAESPAGLVHWQMVDGDAKHLMKWDADGDGRVTLADIDRHFPNDDLFPAMSLTREMLMPPSEGWTWLTARERFANIYLKTKAAALAKPDDGPYPHQRGELRMVAASNNWWKQWFEDFTPMIDHLAEYRGHVSLHFGEIDSQSGGRRQWDFAENQIRSGIFAKVPRLVLHRNCGHSLRRHQPAAGPMDEEAKMRLIDEIREIFSRR
ncbi:MAG: hypothetical protein P4L99_05935 [Chthoniobacter sp.]|nr:hypothetical protein [Chthoniobacter sp.]